MRYSIGIEMQYMRVLRQLVRTLRDKVSQYLVPLLSGMVAQLRQDADDWNDQLNNALARITREMAQPTRLTEQQLERIGSQTEQFNRKEWTRLIRSAYGVGPTKHDPARYESIVNNWAYQNASLIKNITDKAVYQIRETTIDALQSGRTVADLKAEVQERLDVSDSRAQLIARDQVSKLNGDLTKERQTEAGVSKYRWITVGDERVRESHDDCDGEIFDWDGSVSENGISKPDGNDPGGDFQCRCYAEPILPSRMEFEAELAEEFA